MPHAGPGHAEPVDEGLHEARSWVDLAQGVTHVARDHSEDECDAAVSDATEHLLGRSGSIVASWFGRTDVSVLPQRATLCRICQTLCTQLPNSTLGERPNALICLVCGTRATWVDMTFEMGKGESMERINLGVADGLPVVDWEPIAERLGSGEAPPRDAPTPVPPGSRRSTTTAAPT